MQRRYEIVTFDCYGTLVDWESGITGAFAEQARAKQLPFDREQIVALHAEVEPAIQRGPYRSYREVLSETARQIAGRLGWKLDPGEDGFLSASLPRWESFPDTIPALERIRRSGLRLGILSNVDDDLLAGTLARLPVRFDLLVTAEQVRSYKPAHEHFLSARARLDGARWLHAAQSLYHDVTPARALDIPVAWINRKREPVAGEARPDFTFPDLRGLAEWLA